MAILPQFLREPQDDGDETLAGQQNQIELQRRTEALFDRNPSFLDDPDAPEVEAEPEGDEKGDLEAVAGLFDPTIFPEGSFRRKWGNLRNSIYKSIPGAVDEAVSTGKDLLRAAASVSQNPLVSEDARARSLAWFDEHQDAVPFGEELLDKYLPTEDKLAYHAVEEIGKFTVALLGFSKFIKAPQLAGKIGFVAKRGRNAVIAGLAAFTAMDPDGGRLFDWLNDRAPDWMANRFFQYMASDEDDSALEGRFKNGLEFLMLDATIVGAWQSARITKRLAKRQPLTGMFDEKAVAREIKAIADEAPEAVEEAFSVLPNADGTFSVIETGKKRVFRSGPLPKKDELLFSADKPSKTIEAQGGEAARPIDIPEEKFIVVDADDFGNVAIRDEGERAAKAALMKSAEEAGFGGVQITGSGATGGKGTSEFITRRGAEEAGDLVFKTAGEAEVQAAALGFAKRNAETPRGKLSDPGKKEWAKATAEMNEAKTLEEAMHAIDSGDVPMSYTQTVDEAVKSIQEMADQVVLKGTTETVSRDEMVKLAEGIFPNMTADEVLQAMGSVFGDTKRLPETIVAMRGWMVSQTNRTKTLSLLADLNPGNSIVNEELAHSMDSLLKMYARVAGTGSNVGRSLQALSIDPLAGEVSKITNSLDAVVQARRVVDDFAQKGVERSVIDAAEKELLAAVKQGEKDLAIEVNPKFSLRSRAEQVEQGYQGLRDVEVLAGGVAEAKALRAPRAGRASVAGLTRRQIRALSRNVFLSDTPWETLKLLTAPRDEAAAIASRAPRNVLEKIAQAAIRWRMNAMLSGPVTQGTNASMNAAFAFQRPLEYMWAGIDPVNAVFNGGFRPELARMGWDMMTAFRFELHEAWRMGAKSWKVGDNILDPGVNHTGRIQKALKRAGGSADNTYQGGLGWLELFMDAPTRLLMSSDEMFQQLSYRAVHRAQLWARARQLGVKDPGRYVADGMEMGFDAGRGINPSAIEFSRVATFKNSLEYGFGKSLQQAANNNYLIKSIFPFVRTPTNLFRQSWRRTPVIGMAQRQWREDFMAGGSRRAIAIAQQEMGVAFMAMGYMLVQSGDITGRGPQDPDLRRQWQEAGNKPWSIRIPGTKNTWVSYRRADPVMSQIGVLADVNMAMSEMTEDDLAEVTATILASVMASSTSKTYMQGASQAMDALGSGDPGAIRRFVRNYVGSYVPNVLRQAGVPAVDEYQREVNSVVDNVLNRTVGFSDKLEARRNLLGEKVLRSPGFPQSAFLPFTLSFNKRDALDDLVILGRAMPMPPEKLAKGEIDLKSRSDWSEGTSPRMRNQSPYDRQFELMNTKLRGGRTLREAVEKVVASARYKRSTSGGEFEKGGEKYKLVERVIVKYQDIAWRKVLKEYPALAARVHEFDRVFKKDSRENVQQSPNIFDLVRP